MPKDQIIAIGLLSQRDLDILGPTFKRLWPVENAPDFDELLKAIDDADEELERRGRCAADPSATRSIR